MIRLENSLVREVSAEVSFSCFLCILAHLSSLFLSSLFPREGFSSAFSDVCFGFARHTSSVFSRNSTYFKSQA